LTLLRVIWLLSLGLAVVAIAVMLTLIVARLITTHLAERRAVERRKLLPMMLGREAGDAAILRTRPALVAELYLELIQLVRGEERTQFVERAERLGIPDQLARQARSGSRRRRVRAVQALCEFVEPVTREALQRALDDGDEDVRLAAAIGLATQGDVADAGKLMDKLALGAAQPSLLVVSLLRRIAENQPDQIKALALQMSGNPEIRLAAIEALATTGDYSLVPTVVESALTAEDGSGELPRYLHMLGRLGHPAARPAILAGLSRQDMAARAAAAGAAGRIRLRESADQLALLLDDAEWWVRFRAAEALILLGDPGIARLRAAAVDGSGGAREAAETMLAEHGTAA
jgi:HEAT repeat protein